MSEARHTFHVQIFISYKRSFSLPSAGGRFRIVERSKAGAHWRYYVILLIEVIILLIFTKKWKVHKHETFYALCIIYRLISRKFHPNIFFGMFSTGHSPEAPQTFAQTAPWTFPHPNLFVPADRHSSWAACLFQFYLFTTFLPRCRMQTWSSNENYVCSSVRPSVKRVNCDKMKEKSVQIFILYERLFSLVFWKKEWFVEGNPPLPEILGQLAPVEAKSYDWWCLACVVCVQGKLLSWN